jgi:signal transduction histidine kinase
MIRFRSISQRLIAMHVAAILAATVALPLVLYWRIDTTARRLHERALREQAEQIAGFVHRSNTGAWRFDLPPPLQQLYSVGYNRYGFAILTGSGEMLFGNGGISGPEAGAAPRSERPAYFQRSVNEARLFGVSVPFSIDGTQVWVQVTEDEAHRDVLIDDIVASFLPHAAWVVAPILLILLGIDLLIFRNALQPLQIASDRARQIGPARTDLRLPEAGMPREVLPLVRAVNEALNRLAHGYAMQRDFVADAAHELRTPLAIIKAEVEALPVAARPVLLLSDIDGIVRIVNQLIETAESETLAIDPHEVADLHAVCVEVAAFLAPIALEDAKSIAVLGEEGPVWVVGHAAALFQALRNVVENAIRHTPSGSAVEMTLHGSGVTIIDAGSGIPPAQRELVFRRFWRGDRRRSGSAGLGLSIVQRIVKAHGGSITIEDAPGGGALFRIVLPTAAAPGPSERDGGAHAGDDGVLQRHGTE